MIWFIGGIMLGLGVIKLIEKDNNQKDIDMANTNKLFLDFHKEISLTPAQLSRLATSRTALQNRIINHFKSKEGVSTPKFWIQGSKKMGTMIVKKDGTYDVDLGVYLQEKPTVTSTTVQGYVFDAVDGHTDEIPQHLKKCIRVIYKCDFDIDLPVYYMEDGTAHPCLAIKNDGWREDDPKEMYEWFCLKKKDTKGQLVRLVKYLKAWADERSFKMPNGISMTVWAANNYVADERDDKSLLGTLKNIAGAVYWSVSCQSPVVPYDDLTSNLDDAQKSKFKKALDEFITDAKKAIESDNQLKASKLWQKHLGNRFPDGVDEDVDKKEAQLNLIAATILTGGAKTDASGKIQKDSGIPNLKHRNFGGVTKFFIPNSGTKFSMLHRELSFIQRYYNFIKSKISNGILYCHGSYQPSNKAYKYLIRYDGFNNPNVTITSQEIEYNDDIHLYARDNSLCLHFPKDKDWTPRLPLSHTIIPWIHEWLVFYELYLITGRWQHPYVPHKRISNINN